MAVKMRPAEGSRYSKEYAPADGGERGRLAAPTSYQSVSVIEITARSLDLLYLFYKAWRLSLDVKEFLHRPLLNTSLTVGQRMRMDVVVRFSSKQRVIRFYVRDARLLRTTHLTAAA